MIRLSCLLILTMVVGVARAECEDPSLVVDENAQSVKYRACWQVEYQVQESFPADALIRRVTDKLIGLGWKRMDTYPAPPRVSKPVLHAWTVQPHGDSVRDVWTGWFNRDDGSKLQLVFQYFFRHVDEHRPVYVWLSVVSPEPRDVYAK